MNTALKLTAAITTALLLTAPVQAGTRVQEMATICKAGALDQFAQTQPSRVKFKGVSGPRSEKNVRLQVFPENGDAFDATCKLNSKTGEIISVSRQS